MSGLNEVMVKQNFAESVPHTIGHLFYQSAILIIFIIFFISAKSAKNKDEKQGIFSRSLIDSFNNFTFFNVTTSRFVLAFKYESRPAGLLTRPHAV